MQKLSIKWGLICGTFMVGIPFISYLLMGGGPETFKIGEIIGYATIILALLLIFLALNEYRQLQADQKISFIRGLCIGLLISAIAGALFGIYNVIYVEILEPEFMDQYYSYYLEQLANSSASPAEIARKTQAFEQEKAMFMNIYLQFFIMFLTVFVIGTIVSLFCAAIQCRIKPQV